MNTYFLSIDIGASSGRHMLVSLNEGNTISLKEVYRFENGLTKRNGFLCWDHDYLYNEILAGLIACKREGCIPKTIGIDTWGVDFVLLDKLGERIGDTVAYRDNRTKGMEELTSNVINAQELYERTGIAYASYNTVYQLMYLKEKEPWQLEKAKHFLMTPDYLYYRLTGKMMNEYTIASTTSLVNIKTGEWDKELIGKMGLPIDIFHPLKRSGEVSFPLKKEIEEKVGFSCKVVLTPSHDTASAVMAVPATCKEPIFLSSGTWSLLGIDTNKYTITEESREAGFTNEGGYGGRYRYLKNIVGLWLIQQVKKEWKDAYSFSELCSMAEEIKEPFAYIDVSDDMFLAPESMIEAIKDFCKEYGQKVPETPGQIANVIYHSLAKYYAQTVKELEKVTKKTYDVIHIVGGGAKATYLNDLTHSYTNKEVVTGPKEATAIGNALAQMIAVKDLDGLETGRQIIRNSLLAHSIE